MMINLSVEYALLGLIYLAKNEKRNVKISEIAQAENISVSFLQKVFQKLSKAKIVKATFGPNGGFKLIIPAHKLTLKQVMDVMKKEVNKQHESIINELNKHADGKYLLNIMNKVYQNHMQYINKITLKQIINQK